VMEAINATFPSDSDVLSSVEIEKKALFFIQAVPFTFIVQTKWPYCEMIQSQVFSRWFSSSLLWAFKIWGLEKCTCVGGRGAEKSFLPRILLVCCCLNLVCYTSFWQARLLLPMFIESQLIMRESTVQYIEWSWRRIGHCVIVYRML
jgi:hypothetical protein